MYLHVSLHHPVGIICGIREAVHVGKHLASNTENTQLTQVGVSQDIFLFLQTFLTQLDNLGQDSQKAG